MNNDVIKIFKQWLKNERKAIYQVYGRSRDGFPRGLRAELEAVEGAFKDALEGKLSSNG
jgi:hypothetical protein